MNIVDIKNVTKRYDDNLAVDNVNLQIKKGELFGLLGPNGAGKSTLISMLSGLISFDKGEMFIGEKNVKAQPVEAKKYIGLIPQEIALYENLSGLENLKFWGSMYGLRGKELKNRIEEAIETTALKEKIKDKLKTYSGGMKRRLNIACSIMHHPEIIIMDEPTVGIDPQSRNHILEFTKKLNRDYNTTIIYTTHYMEEVEFLCNKLAIIDEGKIIAQGSKEDIKKLISYDENINIVTEDFNEALILKLNTLKGIKNVSFLKNTLSLVADNSSQILSKVIETLVNNNVKIKDMNISSPDLETVFLALTGKALRD
ncbi:ABC transporter ATP-binding protein [Desnuesiella massiliensis]|uniref:ABC transporter ATP-binding protein n=1 Tax=Desnuesiella massiliensis TaxID=1650662 RepID=UPI0006E2F513|nr:ABC transporter ATP-binding protein [Desnuesiella massiliensis]